MKVISKIIVWILSIIFVFILVNIGFGIYKYNWVSNYSEILNQQDWKSTISDIIITNPISILNIFYLDTDLSTWENNDALQDTGMINDVILKSWDNEIDPYDPEFEEDFNSFFGTDDSESQVVVEIEEEPWFINQDIETKNNDSSVGQQLIDKFSQQ
jgi:hypothetical protein